MSWDAFLKWYLRIFVITAFAAALLLRFPGGIFLGLILLYFPVYVLFFTPTFFVYLVAIGPGVLIYDRTRNVYLAWLIGAISVAAVSYGLPKYGRSSFDNVARSYQRDSTGVLPSKIGADIVVQDARWQRTYTDCTKLCQELLRLSPIKSVYISSRQATQVHRLKDPNCSLTEQTPSGLTLGHPVRRCFASETASLPRIADMTIKLLHLDKNEFDLTPNWPAQMTRAVQVSFEFGTGQAFKRTYIEGLVPSSPYWVTLAFSHGVPKKWHPAGQKTMSWEEQVVRDVRNSIEDMSKH